MRVYHDWEFEERNGFIDVISAGFVREDGEELYIVFNDFDTLSVARNEWLMKNVMPSIGHEEYTSHVTGTGQPVKDLYINDPHRMSKRLARQRILEFVQDITPEWWAWYGAYDHVALCSVFGRMVDLPVGWPMVTMDLKQMHKAAGYPRMPRQPKGLHNALEDARYNKVRYDFLTRVLKGTTLVVARNSAQWIEWSNKNLDPSDFSVCVTNADQLRGLEFSQSRDRVVWLVPETQELKLAVDLAFRKP